MFAFVVECIPAVVSIKKNIKIYTIKISYVYFMLETRTTVPLQDNSLCTLKVLDENLKHVVSGNSLVLA
jgi:hypothetical protein